MAAEKKTVTVRVRALSHGFYGTRRRRGAEFEVTGEVNPKTGKPVAFSSRWMQDITHLSKEAKDKTADLGDLTKPELIEKLKALGVEIPARAKLDDLVAMYDAAVKAEGEGSDGGDGGGDNDDIT